MLDKVFKKYSPYIYFCFSNFFLVCIFCSVFLNYLLSVFKTHWGNILLVFTLFNFIILRDFYRYILVTSTSKLLSNYPCSSQNISLLISCLSFFIKPRSLISTAHMHWGHKDTGILFIIIVFISASVCGEVMGTAPLSLLEFLSCSMEILP